MAEGCLQKQILIVSYSRTRSAWQFIPWYFPYVAASVLGTCRYFPPNRIDRNVVHYHYDGTADNASVSVFSQFVKELYAVNGY